MPNNYHEYRAKNTNTGKTMTGGKMIGLTVCIILTLFTGNKLRKMLAIRGWFPGARVEMKVITGKEETSGRPTPAYWIAWDHENPKAMGNHRVNLDFEPWSALSIRDEIEVRYIGKDPSPYLRTGIYASAGNFVFDIILFLVEIGGALYCALPALQRRSARPGV